MRIRTSGDVASRPVRHDAWIPKPIGCETMLKELTVPEVGENVESVQVVKVLVETGEAVAADQAVLELETGKAVVEVPSPEAGTIKQIMVAEGDDVEPGQVYASVETEDAGPSGTKAGEPETPTPLPEEAVPEESSPLPPAPSPEPAPPATPAYHVAAAPSVRKLARELSIDVEKVKGTGPRGRISREDVKRHVRDMNARRAGPVGLALPPLPDFGKWGPVETEKMTAIRRKTATHLTVCWAAIPHVTIHDKADITELDKLRKKYADRATKGGGKLTMAVMVTKVAAAALKMFPKFNASIDMENRQIILKKYCNVGIAVATGRGLVVPVIRDADRKNMVELAAEISAIAEKARSAQLQLEDMEGGTFTVTNLGRVGGSYFTPIINYPEVAILGMGRAVKEPAMVSTEGPRMMLPLSLSFDHRIIDGAEGAAFLGWIVEAIQEPLVLSLEG